MNFTQVSNDDIREEYVRRFKVPIGDAIRDARAAVEHLRCYFSNTPLNESFVIVFLDQQHRIIDTLSMFQGTINTSAVYPREVISKVLELGAVAVILGHNHPSGETTPSNSDRAVTQKLKTALNAIDVEILDHIIVGTDAHYSFQDHSIL
jgi:DNA repair protein RadC